MSGNSLPNFPPYTHEARIGSQRQVDVLRAREDARLNAGFLATREAMHARIRAAQEEQSRQTRELAQIQRDELSTAEMPAPDTANDVQAVA